MRKWKQKSASNLVSAPQCEKTLKSLATPLTSTCSDDEGGVHFKDAVNMRYITAEESKRKRASKSGMLEKILQRRDKFERKEQDDGSTSYREKKQKNNNFLMTKFFCQEREEGIKETARSKTLKKSKKIVQNKDVNKKKGWEDVN